MRRLLLGAGLMLGLIAVPAWAATSDVTVAHVDYSPRSVEVQLGDTVTWHFDGPDTNHSVTADPGQSDSFDSDPGNASPIHAPADTFSHTFNTPGKFTYFCKVHASMHGTVVVTDPNAPPPPADTTPPTAAFDSVKGGRKCGKRAKHCKAKPSRVRFTLSEDAHAKLTFKRSSGRSPAGIERDLKAGAQSFKLSTKRVPRGRYTLTLVATDAAGNASPAATASMRVR
jgi:plastocyanin